MERIVYDEQIWDLHVHTLPEETCREIGLTLII